MKSDRQIDELEPIHEFYRNKIKKYSLGDLEQSVGWLSKESALDCYFHSSNSLHQRWSEFQEVLDIGSGHGSILPVLRTERNFTGTYTGIELLKEFHQSAVERFKEDSKAIWICNDFLIYDFKDKKFDWILSLGSFGVKSPQQEQRDIDTVRKMSKLAKYGFTIFLNDIEQMRPGRLEELPDLAAHNIPEFLDLIKAIMKVAKVETVHFPKPTSQKTLVHVVF